MAKYYNALFDKYFSDIREHPDLRAPSVSYISEGDDILPTDCSIEELLRYPSEFIGKRVSVVGFYDKKKNRLYADINSIDDSKWESLAIENYVRIGDETVFHHDIDRFFVDKKMVVLEGVFEYSKSDSETETPGVVERITKLKKVRK